MLTVVCRGRILQLDEKVASGVLRTAEDERSNDQLDVSDTRFTSHARTVYSE